MIKNVLFLCSLSSFLPSSSEATACVRQHPLDGTARLRRAVASPQPPRPVRHRWVPRGTSPHRLPEGGVAMGRDSWTDVAGIFFPQCWLLRQQWRSVGNKVLIVYSLLSLKIKLRSPSGAQHHGETSTMTLSPDRGEGPLVCPSWAAGSPVTVWGAEESQHLWEAGTDILVPFISCLENVFYLSFLRLN